jgi:soluble lytic murein transglycosylase
VILAAFGFLLGATPSYAQSRALIEAVRVHAPKLGALAQSELDVCANASDAGVTKPCSDHSRLSLLTGVLWLSEGEAARAANQLSSVKAPKKLEAFHGWYLGEAQAYSGQRALALKTLTKAKPNAPPSLARRIDLRIAELQLDLGQASKARPVLEQAASETPTAEALLSRAYARFATQARVEAQKDLRTILIRFPTHPHAAEAMRLLSLDGTPTFGFEEQLMRSQALIAQGAPSEALSQLEATVVPEGKDQQGGLARIALLRGQALLAKGQEADAFAQLEIAMTTGRPAAAAEAMMTKARRLMRAQDHDKARALMLALDAKYPENGNADDAAYLGSWVSLADGKFAQAVADFDQFELRHQSSKKRDEAKWFRAWALFRLGRMDDARNSLAAIMDEFPKSSLVAQARYWSARFAQLGKLRRVSTRTTLEDGGVSESTRASADGGVPIDVAQEYREIAQAFPGTIYSVLAIERLRELNQPLPKLFTEAPKPLKVAPPASLALALELAKTGLLRDAADEVNRVVGTVGSSDDALTLGHALQTISEFGPAHGLAARWLWGQVYTGKRPEALMLMYPRAYQATVEARAAEVGLDPFLAWAIMRRESGFRPEVVSSADARGLMQIIPPTAKAIASELKTTTPAPGRSLRPRSERALRHLVPLGVARSHGPPRALRGLVQRRSIGSGEVDEPARNAAARRVDRGDPVQRDARLREAGAGRLRDLPAALRRPVEARTNRAVTADAQDFRRWFLAQHVHALAARLAGLVLQLLRLGLERVELTAHLRALLTELRLARLRLWVCRPADAGDLLVDLGELGDLVQHQRRQLNLPRSVFCGLLRLGANGGDGSAQLIDEGHGVDSRGRLQPLNTGTTMCAQSASESDVISGAFT